MSKTCKIINVRLLMTEVLFAKIKNGKILLAFYQG